MQLSKAISSETPEVLADAMGDFDKIVKGKSPEFEWSRDWSKIS